MISSSELRTGPSDAKNRQKMATRQEWWLAGATLQSSAVR
jgi:hypothetical protein